MNAANIALLIVQTIAALAALYFAGRTVRESRAADAERRIDRLSERLDDVVAVVAQIRLRNRQAERVQSEAAQDRLRVLVATVPLQLLQTRALSERQFTADTVNEDEQLANEALEELRATARSLALETALGLGPRPRPQRFAWIRTRLPGPWRA